MKVATQSLYHHPGGKAVLREFAEYFYNFMASLTKQSPVMEKYSPDLRHAIKHKYGLLKS